mmetsp:Transcript_5508/g.13059  ORF Transcript_5508/g.13059 Transcript_5508/m.13059 type:complete len:287 (-) Transcript_5508:1008-1868(-)
MMVWRLLLAFGGLLCGAQVAPADRQQLRLREDSVGHGVREASAKLKVSTKSMILRAIQTARESGRRELDSAFVEAGLTKVEFDVSDTLSTLTQTLWAAEGAPDLPRLLFPPAGEQEGDECEVIDVEPPEVIPADGVRTITIENLSQLQDAGAIVVATNSLTGDADISVAIDGFFVGGSSVPSDYDPDVYEDVAVVPLIGEELFIVIFPFTDEDADVEVSVWLVDAGYPLGEVCVSPVATSSDLFPGPDGTFPPPVTAPGPGPPPPADDYEEPDRVDDDDDFDDRFG